MHKTHGWPRASSAEGSLRDLDPQQTATILWAAWSGIISLAWRHDDRRQEPKALAELVGRAADLIVHGLRVR